MIRDIEETYQGVTVEDKPHLPVTGPILHLLQAIADVDVVVDQIRADVGSRKTRKGCPIGLFTSLSWTKGGTSSAKPKPEADALGWPEGPDTSANPG